MGFADRIKAFFRRNTLGDEVFEDLADLLIEGDIGASFALEVVDALKQACRKEGITTPEAARAKLKDILRPHVRRAEFRIDPSRLNIVLMLGVNGVGKTTSCAKLANWLRSVAPGTGVLLAAGDTFRAAAIDQLKIHGQRLGIRVVAQQQGSDPGAVLYDAIEAARAGNMRLVIADTAGRMHTRADLVKELEKMDRIIRQRAEGCAYTKYLVLDATTGQNAMRQAEIFHGAVSIDGIVMTKYDSTSKGGMVIAVSGQFGLPTAFLGTGEKYENFVPFDTERYLTDFVGE
ncbi:MAG: signal recognition particle-docking protein FtsY [Rectinemataceae bacterium]